MTTDLTQAYQQGFQARCEGRYQEARRAFQQVLAAEPNHVDSLHQLALILGFEGDFDGSLDALAKIAVNSPGNIDVRYDLAMTQMMLGMYEEACANFKQILAVNPAHEKALQQITYC